MTREEEVAAMEEIMKEANEQQQRARETLIDTIIHVSHLFAVVHMMEGVEPLKREVAKLPGMLADVAYWMGMKQIEVQEMMKARDKVAENMSFRVVTELIEEARARKEGKE